MNISSQGKPLVDPFCGFSSQGSNATSGSQEIPGFSSQEWLSQGIMPSQMDSQVLLQRFDYLTDFINKDYQTTENDLKSSHGDNVSSQKFCTYSANSQESLQTPDYSRPPAPVVGSQPSVVPSWQPSVNKPARYTPAILNRNLPVKKREIKFMEQYCESFPVEVSSSDKPIYDAARAIISLSQGSRNPSTPPDLQYNMPVTFSEEPFMGHFQSSKPVSRVKRGSLVFNSPPPNRVRANSVSSTVTYESESRSELSSLDDLDEPSEVSSTTSDYLRVISQRPHKQVKAYICKSPTKAKAPSKKSSKLNPPKPYIKNESSQPSRYSSSSIASSGRHCRLRNSSTSSSYSNVSTSSNASSTVNTKNMTKEERELYEMKKADKKERNKMASKRLRDKKKKAAIEGEKEIEVLENKNKALGERIEELELSKANWIQKLLQEGMTKEEIQKKLQLALRKWRMPE